MARTPSSSIQPSIPSPSISSAVQQVMGPASLTSLMKAQLSENDKLKGRKNFICWKDRIQALLVINGCAHVISDTFVCSSPDLLAVDQAVRSILILNVADEWLSLIREASTASAAWKNILSVFESRNYNSQLFVRAQLSQMSLQHNGDMGAHIAKFKGLLSDLRTAGAQVSDDEIVATFLGTLNSDFSNFVTTLVNSSESLSIEDSLGKVLAESNRISCSRPMHKNGETGDTMLVVRRRSGPFRKRFGAPVCQTRSHCIHCKKPANHSADKCWSKPGNRKPNFIPTWNKGNSNYLPSCSLSSTVTWILDTGATKNLTADRSLLHNIQPCVPFSIILGNGGTLNIIESGSLNFELDNTTLQLEVYYHPDISYNLLSVPVLSQMGLQFLFSDLNCVILFQSREQIVCPMINRLYLLYTKPNQHTALVSTECLPEFTVNNETMLWHSRLGHIPYQSMLQWQKDNHCDELSKSILKPEDIQHCQICILNKQIRTKFNTNNIHAQVIGEQFHSDICGKVGVRGYNHEEYTVTFIDEYSNMVFGYSIKTRDQVLIVQ